MKDPLHDDQYRNLAELRHQIRLFLQRSDQTAQEVGVEPQQYQLLLAIRGMDPGQQCTIRALSERLLLRHHSTVELIDRLEANGLVCRSRDKEDRRQVFVTLQLKGEKLLGQIVHKRIDDLRTGGRNFVQALNSLLEKTGSSRARRPSRGPTPGRTEGSQRRAGSR
jgi:DNA-binding MarR family transcriptional regulator